MGEEIRNVFGDPVPEAQPGDPYYIPVGERLDTDTGPLSNALTDETGDDMEGWEPILPDTGDEEE